MKNQITIREAITEADIAVFWGQLHTYHMRDIFPDPENEKRKHFLDDSEYRAQIQRVHDRPQDRCYYLFFHRDGQDIGFALPAIFTSEDGKCFILEFCVFPAFRGSGTGRTCADALLSWAKMRGARYAELNYGGDERRLRFWKRVGFVENGADEWGEPLMLLPPADPVPFTWRFWRTRMIGSCGSWKMASNGRSAKTCLQVPSRNGFSKPSKRGASRFLSPNAAIAPWACAALLHTTRRSPAQTRAYMRIFMSNLPSGARALRENWQKRRSAGARNMGSRA